jgi:hypothetical protein
MEMLTIAFVILVCERLTVRKPAGRRTSTLMRVGRPARVPLDRWRTERNETGAVDCAQTSHTEDVRTEPLDDADAGTPGVRVPA